MKNKGQYAFVGWWRTKALFNKTRLWCPSSSIFIIHVFFTPLKLWGDSGQIHTEIFWPLEFGLNKTFLTELHAKTQYLENHICKTENCILPPPFCLKFPNACKWNYRQSHWWDACLGFSTDDEEFANEFIQKVFGKRQKTKKDKCQNKHSVFDFKRAEWGGKRFCSKLKYFLGSVILIAHELRTIAKNKSSPPSNQRIPMYLLLGMGWIIGC